MPAEHTQSGTPVGAFARAVFTVGVCVTLGTGIGLYAMPARTSDYWAWTINAPLSAAFFGSGYLGAATALFLASRASEWCRARTVAVRIPGVRGAATLERLTGRGITARTGVTLGGQTYGSTTTTGLLAGDSTVTGVTRRGGGYVVRLPRASAAMLTLR